jgi:hypothetical protein
VRYQRAKARRRSWPPNVWENALILVIILILVLIGVVPAWPHSAAWGYGPSGGVGLLLAIMAVLMITGRL